MTRSKTIDGFEFIEYHHEGYSESEMLQRSKDFNSGLLTTQNVQGCL